MTDDDIPRDTAEDPLWDAVFDALDESDDPEADAEADTQDADSVGTEQSDETNLPVKNADTEPEDPDPDPSETVDDEEFWEPVDDESGENPPDGGPDGGLNDEPDPQIRPTNEGEDRDEANEHEGRVQRLLSLLLGYALAPFKLAKTALLAVLSLPIRAAKRTYAGLRRAGARLRYLLFGNGPQDYARRFALLGTGVLFSAAAVGLMYALGSDGALEGSSAGVLRPLLQWGTSGPAVILVLMFYLRGYLFLIGKTVTRKAAAETGYSRQTIDRLQAEALSATGTNRVIVFPDSDREDIIERVKRALDESDYSERIQALTDDSDVDTTDTADGAVDRERLDEYEQLQTEYADLSAEAETLRAEIDDDLDSVLAADFDAESVSEAARGDERFVAPADLLGDDDRDRLDGVEVKVDRLDDLHDRMDALAAEMEAIEAEWTSEEPTDETASLPATPADEPETTGHAEVTDDAHEPKDDRVARAEDRKLAVLDLSTTFEASRAIWQFAVPAVLTFAALLLVSQIWVAWWLYLVFAGLSIAVGGISYNVLSWRRKRRLQSLRADRSPEVSDQISLLVKRVDTDELSMFIGFASGRVYASHDKERFARTVAERSIQRAQGYHPAPALEERYAWCLRKKIPSLKKYRQAEKQEIMDALVTEVRDSGLGMVPKDLLINAVVEHDREYIWRGLRFTGYGYDPDLVAEAYRDLVPSALVEEEVDVEGPNGEERTITAVRTRPLSMSQDIAQLRAAFSDEFRARDFNVRYDVPDVELDEDAPYHTPPNEDSRRQLPAA